MRTLLGCVAIAFAFAGDIGRASGGSPDRPPLLEGLGTYGRKVTTTNATAQRYFDRA